MNTKKGISLLLILFICSFSYGQLGKIADINIYNKIEHTIVEIIKYEIFYYTLIKNYIYNKFCRFSTESI